MNTSVQEVGALALSQPSVAEAAVPADVLAGLGPDGQRFLRAVWGEFEIGALEMEVLRLAARCRDDEEVARESGNVKAAQTASRQFLMALARLGWPLPERSA